MSVDLTPNPIKETFQGYRLRAVALIFYLVIPMITLNAPNL